MLHSVTEITVYKRYSQCYVFQVSLVMDYCVCTVASLSCLNSCYRSGVMNNRLWGRRVVAVVAVWYCSRCASVIVILCVLNLAASKPLTTCSMTAHLSCNVCTVNLPCQKIFAKSHDFFGGRGNNDMSLFGRTLVCWGVGWNVLIWSYFGVLGRGLSPGIHYIRNWRNRVEGDTFSVPVLLILMKCWIENYRSNQNQVSACLNSFFFQHLQASVLLPLLL